MDIDVELGEGRWEFDLKISSNLHSSFCIVSTFFKMVSMLQIQQIVSMYEHLYTRRRGIMFTIITASMEQLSPLKTDRKCVLSDYIEVALRVSLSKGKLDEQAENIDTSGYDSKHDSSSPCVQMFVHRYNLLYLYCFFA
jgi:hypothetical protein